MKDTEKTIGIAQAIVQILDIDKSIQIGTTQEYIRFRYENRNLGGIRINKNSWMIKSAVFTKKGNLQKDDKGNCIYQSVLVKDENTDISNAVNELKKSVCKLYLLSV